ncbi:MAG: D-alanyl-D-alanine carboxypeptidase family protein [Candidatus Limiplasma sp.]|nr:D-alanyl-D-alanine carboxypeptidase family protein [Candidatus Limiplasma sp.]
MADLRKALGRVFAVLLTAVSALSLLPWAGVVAKAQEEQTPPEIRYIAPELPSDALPYDPAHPENLTEDQLYAKSVILIEESTGEVIFEKNADEMMYPASTTKILTTLLGLQHGDMNATVTMDSVSANIPDDSSTIPLSVGETINFQDLLYATMVRSGNEGANLIAMAVYGSIGAFVDLMNQTALELGCTSTHFANANGLHDDSHYTTARDMAKIARVAMQNETFRNIAKTYSYRLPKSNLQRARVIMGNSDNWLNPNEENEYYYPLATGIKTGYHARAGYCYVGSAEKDGVRLISVLLYTSRYGRWTDSKKLMEYGFSQFMSVTPLDLYQMNPSVVETSGYAMDDAQLGRLQLDIQPMADTRTVSLVATRTEVETLARNLKQAVLIEYTRQNFAAPITQGEAFGTMTYYPADGGSPVVYQLVASRSIARRENAPLSIEEIETATYADPNPFPPFSVEFALIAASPFLGLFILIRILMRVFHRDGGRPGKKGRVPKPTNRYFR